MSASEIVRRHPPLVGDRLGRYRPAPVRPGLQARDARPAPALIVSARSGLFLGRPVAVDAVDFMRTLLSLRGSYRHFQAGKLCL